MTELTGHPYQLRRIELRDFKSVGQADVELRPLTVVVGANSSGKSTLLQSILAVTQAVPTGRSTRLLASGVRACGQRSVRGSRANGNRPDCDTAGSRP